MNQLEYSARPCIANLKSLAQAKSQIDHPVNAVKLRIFTPGKAGHIQSRIVTSQ